MRMMLVMVFSTFLSGLIISNAYVEKKQFYPTVVYLLSSNRSLGVIYLQAFVMVWFLCKFLKFLFFGALRASEVEHLVESSWYAILETFILLAAFHQELNLGFVTMVTILFVAKSFHWLAHDRVDFMERSPAITWLFHIRAVTLFALLLLVDYLFVKHSWSTLQSKGFSVDIVFGLEYAIMFLSALSSALHYILHTIDRQSEDPWENKPIYMRLVDIFLGFFELTLYVSYMAFMLYVVLVPLHIARRVYITAKNFQKNIYDVIASRQAIRHLNTLYPDATIEELEAVNNVCVICREEMVSRCKKLPCGHIFHTTCLQSWFQRQQVCPTCRMNVLNRALINRLTQAGAGQGRQQHPQHPPPQQNNGLLPPMMFPPPMMPHMWPHPPQPQAPQQPQGDPQPPPHPPGDGNNAAAQPERPAGSETPPPASQAPPTAGQPPNSQFPMGYPGFPGPFPFPPPPVGFMPPGFGTGPLTGASLQSLSAEQLQQLEGMERANVEARISVLRDVQKLLDSAVLRLNQYSIVMSVISPPAGPGFPGYPFPPFPSQGNPAPTTMPSGSSQNQSGEIGEIGMAQAMNGGGGGGGGEGDAVSPDADQATPSASGSSQECRVSGGGGPGLLQTPNVYSRETRQSSDASSMYASIPDDSDTAAVQQPQQRVLVADGTSGAELMLNKASSHVDSDIRQRRLQRLHSSPTTSQQSLSERSSSEGGLGDETNRTTSREEDDSKA